MSEANVQIVRRLVEHYLATDELPGELFAPTFVWDLSTFRDWPEQRLYEGLDGLRAFIGDWTAVFDGWEFEFNAFHDAGEKVVIVGVQRGRTNLTGGPPVEAVVAIVWTLRESLLIRGEAYADPNVALKAVGLTE
jgi:ketosteroid isomerase-like protein